MVPGSSQTRVLYMDFGCNMSHRDPCCYLVMDLDMALSSNNVSQGYTMASGSKAGYIH